MNLFMMADAVHKMAIDKGFWPDEEERNIGELIALIHSEVSELWMAYVQGTVSEKIPGFTESDEEIADIIVRCLDMCEGKDIDGIGAMQENLGESSGDIEVLMQKAGALYGKEMGLAEGICLLHSKFSELLETTRNGRAPTHEWDEKMGRALTVVLAIAYNIDCPIDSVLTAKIAYNSQRPQKHGKNF